MFIESGLVLTLVAVPSTVSYKQMYKRTINYAQQLELFSKGLASVDNFIYQRFASLTSAILDTYAVCTIHKFGVKVSFLEKGFCSKVLS